MIFNCSAGCFASSAIPRAARAAVFCATCDDLTAGAFAAVRPICFVFTIGDCRVYAVGCAFTFSIGACLLAIIATISGSALFTNKIIAILLTAGHTAVKSGVAFCVSGNAMVVVFSVLIAECRDAILTAIVPIIAGVALRTCHLVVLVFSTAVDLSIFTAMVVVG